MRISCCSPMPVACSIITDYIPLGIGQDDIGVAPIDDDEHAGEYDDAPDIQDEDYDSDVPLAKRRRNSHDEDMLDYRAGYRKATRIREREEGKRPRVSDYESDARHILVQAILVFKSLVSSQDAYPDKLTEMTWAKQSWWEAADKLDIELAPNRECIKIVSHDHVCDRVLTIVLPDYCLLMAPSR